MKFIIGLILFSAFILVAYTPLREIFFFTGDVAAKDSGTWQEIYNCTLGLVLMYIQIKGFVLLFPRINQVSPFRVLIGLILFATFCFLGLNSQIRDLLFFRNPQNFIEAAINCGWAIIGMYGLFKGGYCIWAGNRFIPGFDDGDWEVSFEKISNEQPTVNNTDHVNKNIQSILDYRNSKVAMMSNDQAIAELGKTAGLEMYLNDNSSYAKYLDSKLGMKSNNAGYQHVQNLFGSNNK